MPGATAEPAARPRVGAGREHAPAARWRGLLGGGRAAALATLAVAGLLCFLTFTAGGGLALDSMTTVELALTLGGGVFVAGALLLGPPRLRAYGLWPVVLMLALSALTALSVAWSVVPDSSWQDAGRMFAYSAVFAAAVAAARLAPRGWAALLGGVVLAAAVVCGYALLTKVFPAQLDAQDIYARLQEPYGYWNAIGLTAALGATACLWLGARRAGHALASAMAYPVMGLMLVTVMLAYSRGALVALAVGVALWMVIVPLRLRGALVLIVGGLGAAPVIAWDFAQHSLTSDGVAIAQRATAGHQLGAAVLAMLIALAVAGVAIGFFGARRAPSTLAKRRAGALLVGLLVLAVAAGLVGLAASRRGFTGTISHTFTSLTDPNAPLPKNTPGRLTSLGSVRARYWKEALQIFSAHPAVGVGAAGYEVARLRYRSDQREEVHHAHGYIVQTLADLGIAGLALTLALLAAWLACAGRATRPLNGVWRVRRARRLGRAGGGSSRLGGVSLAVPVGVSWRRAPALYTAERIGLLSMLCVVVVFGVHSLADWTWYVPGNACVALLCAGWLAGRGPLAGIGPAAERQPRTATGAVVPDGGDAAAAGGRGGFALSGRAAWRPSVRAGAMAAAVLALALLAAWSESQPQRSAQSSEQALAVLSRNPPAALAEAKRSVDRDPLSLQALFTLAAVQRAAGTPALARATLQKAVRLQPSNPQSWLALGEQDLSGDPGAAVQELRAAVYLDPRSVPIQNAYVQALRAAPAAAPAVPAVSPNRRAAPAGKRAGARRPHL